MIGLTDIDVIPYRYTTMSSIHKVKGKPNWFCAFYNPEGFRRFKTTGTDNAKIARTICVNIERASKLASDNKLSNEKGLKLIRDTCTAIEETHGKLAANRAHDILKNYIEEFVKIAGGELTAYTVKSWLDTWLTGRTDASKATIVEYRRVIDLFQKFLGARADRPLTTLQPKQIEDFKSHIAKRVAPSTVNKSIKVLKASFNNAVAKRQLEFSPAEHVESIEVEEGNRRPFTNQELKDLLKAANAEWQTMILVAFYTGLIDVGLATCCVIFVGCSDFVPKLVTVTKLVTITKFVVITGKGVAFCDIGRSFDPSIAVLHPVMRANIIRKAPPSRTTLFIQPVALISFAVA
jgi:hypothetical protein